MTTGSETGFFFLPKRGRTLQIQVKHPQGEQRGSLAGRPRAAGLSGVKQSNNGSAVLKVWVQLGHAASVVPMLLPIVPYRGGVPELSVLTIHDEEHTSIFAPTRP